MAQLANSRAILDKFSSYVTSLQRFWFPAHGNGVLQSILEGSQKIPTQNIVAWAKDTDHGLLHGLLVGFWGTWLHPQAINDYDFLTNAILHDFVKSAFNVEENHDGLLEKYFQLDQSTYSHSSPAEITPLVSGDRLELLRFEDHSQWVDFEMIQGHDHTDVLCFFETIRPALALAFSQRSDIWIRHRIEGNDLIRRAIQNHGGTTVSVDVDLFPNRYWSKNAAWSVEVGNLLQAGDERYNRLVFEPKNWLACSDGIPNPVGLLPLSSLKKYQNVTGTERDHQLVTANVPMYEWMFLIDKKINLQSNQLDGCRGVMWEDSFWDLMRMSQKIIDLLIFYRS